MTLLRRVLPETAHRSLDDFRRAGGTEGLRIARGMAPDAVVAALEQSGLRGRGGAGFPTGTKWRAVLGYAGDRPTTVVVNGAEGEPFTYKDRTILRMNPYAVVEGALVAAHVAGAVRVVIGVKRTFVDEVAIVRRAVHELTTAGVTGAVAVDVVEGPDEYLFGEETALLEVIDGRGPFPRLAPPFRRGVGETVRDDPGDATSGSGLAAPVAMAEEGAPGGSPPALVDNVETMVNVALILANGPEWFRLVGTERSPGTIVCTITGSVARPGVGEVALGTTVAAAIDEVAGGVRAGATVKAVLNGVSSAPLDASELDTPLTYEDLAAIGSGLGTASLHVLDDATDLSAVAAGVARFLSVESCGQCLPCKDDGLALSRALHELCGVGAADAELVTVRSRLATVADGARCALARQQQDVVGRLVELGRAELDRRIGADDAVEPLLVSELRSLEHGVVVLDERHRDKQPDWTFDATWHGASPVDRQTDHRAEATE